MDDMIDMANLSIETNNEEVLLAHIVDCHGTVVVKTHIYQILNVIFYQIVFQWIATECLAYVTGASYIIETLSAYCGSDEMSSALGYGWSVFIGVWRNDLLSENDNGFT